MGRLTAVTVAAIMTAGVAEARHGYSRYDDCDGGSRRAYRADACDKVAWVNPCAPRGYYAYRPHRVWVPGRWVYKSFGYGCWRQVWLPPRYEVVSVRVWIAD